MKKMALMADSPFVTSGFAQPANMIVKAFTESEDFEVFVLGQLDTKIRDLRNTDFMYHPACKHDPESYQILIDFLQFVSPDILMMIGDPGGMSNRVKQFEMTGLRGIARSMCYFPIEGLPIQPSYAGAVAAFDFPVTYCQFGAEAMKASYNLNVHVAPHGFDHGPFEQYPDDVRNELRHKIAWDDKFIVSMVGVNKRTNRYPVLVEAMGILLEKGYDDIFMYLHTSPVDVNGGLMAGYNLGWQINMYRARDKYGKSHILFAPEYTEGGHIYRGVDYRLPVDKILALDFQDEFDGSPESKRAAVFSRMGYITRMNLIDMYIDVASVHGWNLPAGEAMRCGAPVAMVDDGFARSEVYVAPGVVYPMEPSLTVDYWHTGAKMKLVDVEVVVDTILKLYHDIDLRKELAAKGKEFADGMKWEVMTKMFLDAARGLS